MTGKQVKIVYKFWTEPSIFSLSLFYCNFAEVFMWRFIENIDAGGIVLTDI